MYQTDHEHQIVMVDRKWLTDPDDYICKLPHETQKIAKDELNEDTQCRDQALKSFREWIMQNPRIINCRIDSNFLIRFLRFTKFNVPRAQESFEQYLELRKCFKKFLDPLDICLPEMQALSDLGIAVACPQRDKKGRRICLLRPGVFDFKKFSNADLSRIGAITYETLSEDEENQIRGLIYICDVQGVGLSYTRLFSLMDIIKVIKSGEKNVPCRHVQCHILNLHWSVKWFLNLCLSLVSKKIRSRVSIYCDLEEFLSSESVDIDILPIEYGGVTPMADMIALWKEEMFKANQTLLSYSHMEIANS